MVPPTRPRAAGQFALGSRPDGQPTTLGEGPAMRPKPIPVWQIAKETGADVDSVLLATWDFVHVDGRALDVLNSRDKIPAPLVAKVRQSLGIATRRELHSVKYWRTLLGMSKGDFQTMLSREGYSYSLRQRNLPPGAQKFLMRLARRRRIDPLTGKTASPKPVKRVSSRNHTVRHPPPSFSQVGRHPRDCRWLSVGQVLAIHNTLVSDFAQSADPIAPPGVRDDNLLESAVYRPQTGFAGMLKYPTIETSAAALLCSLIHDHPFHNGNKRTALVAMLAFLDGNGFVLTCNADELFQFVLLVAKHRVTERHRHFVADYETLAVANKIAKWSRVVSEVGIAPSMTFRKLRTVLERRGCEIRIKGSRAHIHRNAPEAPRAPFARRLRTQIPYRDDGTDMPTDHVRKIRRDLQLDSQHGHDDDDFFYSRKPTHIDDFIAEYRKILVRLAKL